MISTGHAYLDKELWPVSLGDAAMSPCKRYRYSLYRRWADGKFLNFIMLNPSTADGKEDDPTIRRCMYYARRDGFAGIWVTNLFAFRATLPSALKKERWPVGDNNDARLESVFSVCTRLGVPIIAAWGVHGSHQGRDLQVAIRARALGAELLCFGVTKDGHPKHPLYQANDAVLVPYKHPAI